MEEETVQSEEGLHDRKEEDLPLSTSIGQAEVLQTDMPVSGTVTMAVVNVDARKASDGLIALALTDVGSLNVLSL